MQPVEGSIRLTLTDAIEIVVFSLSQTGQKMDWIPASVDSSGSFCFEINGTYETPWYGIEIVREGRPEEKGDTNGDGHINILDVVLTISIILETYDPTPEQMWAADMNEDGTITIVDVLLIVNIILSSSQ